MPETNEKNVAAYQPCSNCGDLKSPGARICSHCGAGIEPGLPVIAAGVTILRVLFAAGIAILVLPLGALGACGVIVGAAGVVGGLGFGTKDLSGIGWIAGIFLLGVLLLALAAGGLWLVVHLLRGRG
jgi:hypothetical protein